MRTSKWQMTRFSIVYLGSQSTMFLIPGLIETSSYQGWISLILGGFLGLILLYFTILVGKLKPGIGWVEFGAEIMGKWLHGIIVILLLCWCINYVSYDIHNFALFFGGNYLRGTPPLFIILVVGLVIMYTAHLGFASMVYMSEGIALICIVFAILSTYLFIQHAEYSMLPAFIHYHDPRIVIKDSITVMSWFGEWVVFLFVAPELKISNKIMKPLSLGGITVILIVLIVWLMTMLNFGPYLGKELQFPFLQMIRSSSNDDLLGNSDPILIGIWSSSMFIHSSFMIYVAYRCALYLTRQKAKKVMIPLLTVCSITIAFVYSMNVAVYYHNYYSFNTTIFWLIVEFIPVYYFIVAWVRSKSGKQLK
ncbi:hypothetical protein QW71_02410 [Paenibacillus sp. IHB B 3415]|uniref:GerAB/ArcD/ProY family transporter n=1 Tax=Paenibacillus sp. IHB B 3415 TaxID=867080 RepID=UPI00057323AD|nr:GerAB/ArcD/ProY family transporter [Paenibacillus sp. IHB B 3415]KHL97234.1 hypothetical protein QW71_02410 [Paenibacillus sp. IHB B 3415]